MQFYKADNKDELTFCQAISSPQKQHKRNAQASIVVCFSMMQREEVCCKVSLFPTVFFIETGAWKTLGGGGGGSWLGCRDCHTWECFLCQGGQLTPVEAPWHPRHPFYIQFDPVVKYKVDVLQYMKHCAYTCTYSMTFHPVLCIRNTFKL